VNNTKRKLLNKTLPEDKTYTINAEYFNSLSSKYKVKLMMKEFKYYLYFLWAYQNLPAPSKLQLDIAHFMQYGGDRLMVQAGRGVGKTMIDIGYASWLLWKNPNEFIMIVSATAKFAEEIAKGLKKILQFFPLINSLDPSKTTNNSITSFDVYGRTNTEKSPSVKCVGINGQLTGSRATLIIADDIETKKNSLTSTMREGILDGVQEFTNVIKKGGKIMYFGTPQTEETIYQNLPQRGYNVKIWPSRYPFLDKVKNYKGLLAEWIEKDINDNPDLQWEATNPQQFTTVMLDEKELDNGKSSHLLQYMLDSSLSDSERYPLKLSDLIIFNCNNNKAPINISWGSGRQNEIDIHNVGFGGDKWYKPMFVDDVFIEYEGSILAIDPSGRGSDETGYSVIKILHGFLYVLESGGIKGGYDDDTLMSLAMIAKEYNVNEVVVETNFGDGMYEKLLGGILKRVYPVKIVEVRSTTQKETRIIDTLEPLMNRHKLIINESIIHNDMKQEDPDKQLFYQLTRLTKDRGALKHDDRLDALAIGVKYWIDYLSIDEIEASTLYKEEMLNKELESFRSYKEAMLGSTNNFLQNH